MARRWRQVKKEISKWCTTWTWQTNWRRREYPWPKVLDACLFIYKAIFKGRGGRIKWHHKNMAKTSVKQSRKWIKTNFLRNAHTPWSGGGYITWGLRRSGSHSTCLNSAQFGSAIWPQRTTQSNQSATNWANRPTSISRPSLSRPF